jgi:calcyclin binding protein
MQALGEEIAELQALLAQVKTPGNVRDLTSLLRQKQQALDAEQENEAMKVEASAAPAVVAAPPQPVQVVKETPIVDDVAVFTEISRFGWEDDGFGKQKVSVLVLSGVDGVGSLPEQNVTCHFTKTSFDLKVGDPQSTARLMCS